jgi:hypothetical protein
MALTQTPQPMIVELHPMVVLSVPLFIIVLQIIGEKEVKMHVIGITFGVIHHVGRLGVEEVVGEVGEDIHFLLAQQEKY